jgi:hypothetical protein
MLMRRRDEERGRGISSCEGEASAHGHPAAVAI